MSDLGVFHGPNAGYVLDLYDRYLEHADSVGPEWKSYFQTFTPAQPSSNGAAMSLQQASPASSLDVAKIVGASELVGSIRDYGHLAARLDPLGSDPPGSPDLDPSSYGLSDADLAAMSPAVVSGPLANDAPNAARAIEELRAVYCGSIGFDFDHVQQIDERRWLYDAVETQRFAIPMGRPARRALLRRLTDVEAFEKFLHQTYLGQKRFSLEGNDMLVPMLDEIIAELFVEVDDHLGVAARAERVAERREFGDQRPIVVDLAVVDDDHRAVLVVQRLAAAAEIDDREAPVS